MTGGGSVVVRRQLGSKLRRLRLAAGKDVADVTAAGLGSKAKMSRIETGKGPVKVADIRALCWLYGAGGPTTEALAALAPATRQEDRWKAFTSTVVPDWFALYAGLEASASRIRCFEPVLVHGLVQTSDYARAVMETDARLDKEIVEERVRFRMERQRTKADVTIILGEGALRRVAGPREVMAAQLDHLRSVAADVRVVPFSAGLYLSRGTFALLDFDDDDDPPVAYVEGAGSARLFDRPADRAEFEYAYEMVLSKSVPIQEVRT
jgi:hypothetical protein